MNFSCLFTKFYLENIGRRPELQIKLKNSQPLAVREQNDYTNNMCHFIATFFFFFFFHRQQQTHVTTQTTWNCKAATAELANFI